MIAAYIMRPHPEVLAPGDTLLGALRLLCGTGSGCAPVVDRDGRLVGVVTTESVLDAWAGPTRDVLDAHGMGTVAVERVMDTGFSAVGPETGIKELLRLLSPEGGGEGGAGRGGGPLAVVDDGGRLLGLIGPEDVLKRIWEYTERERR
ncbi:MAG: CBS domain-containing protein [Thermodesulfobacteriota bacterium]